MIERAGDAVVIHDLAGKILDANPQACESLGYARGELLAKSVQDLGPGFAGPEMEALRDRVLAGEQFTLGARRLRRDGSTYPVDVTLASVDLAGERVFLTIVRDLSLRTDQEEVYKQLIDTMNDTAFVIDFDGKFVDINERAVEVLGYSRAELLALGPAKIDPYLAEQDIRELIVGMQRGERQLFQTQHRTKDGTIIPVEISSSPISYHGQAAILSIARDITERKRAEMMTEARLRLLELAPATTLEGFLQATLDELEALTSSLIGFCNFLEPDGDTLTPQAWSTRTRRDFCKGGQGLKLLVSRAGVWADCIRQRGPVIHNDYASLPHRKGMPPGHAVVTREVVVPVFRNDDIVAVFAVGNKPSEYVERDVEIVSELADLAWDIAGRKRAEERLRRSEALLIATGRMAKVGGWEFDMESQTITWTDEVFRIHSVSRDFEPTAVTAMEFYPPEIQPVISEAFRRVVEEGERFDLELPLITAEGKRRWVHAMGEAQAKDGLVVTIEGTFQDITERRQAEEALQKSEEQLRQSQKMESVGRLAGGVAHDFNNMLGVILGHAELAMQQLDPHQPVYANLQEIRDAANRSARIAQQLLAFARRQTAIPTVLDPNGSVERILDMIQRLVGEDIEVVWLPGRDLGTVVIDPSQLDQVLVNLCANARDAIAGAGKVTIETAPVYLDEDFCAGHEGCVPGDYVLLSLSDNGSGMDEEALEHLFEPFFTTKETGKGTGLGMAMVYGIVKQNNGYIDVQSERGLGTTVRIYLPRRTEPAAKEEKKADMETSRGGGETLLVVEDESSVLKLAERVLKSLGYRVLTAMSPSEALRTAEQWAGQIDLLVTDVIMPEMGGWSLADSLTAARPRLKTLYVSGYPAEVISGRGLLEQGVRFLQKPFSPHDLATSVRAALDQD